MTRIAAVIAGLVLSFGGLLVVIWPERQARMIRGNLRLFERFLPGGDPNETRVRLLARFSGIVVEVVGLTFVFQVIQ